ncbi:5-methyltetrahydrofolate--homocysteine methyltransferase [candidate division KSB3 bacterium]|uniref:Methionine synthase n=1 Tax=candidate division KSB3 bacterium TaxID=2044937 RepID=A0A2G6KLB1_9BACT|nr:MAG: 5-methyltetrahydrofolate--homocysteine methyltransferase [candidate division KSB3 bacterium]
MTVQELYELLAQRVLILDGATGTELQKRGMPKGVCPEQWVIDHPDVIIGVQQTYIEAGSDAVFTCTFGANRIKLEEFGLQDRAYEMNKTLAELSRKAVGSEKIIAGNMSPTGRFIDPFGDVPFDECIDIFQEQARGLRDGGVDLFVIETMIDIQEMRAAVLAVKELCELPIIASMTFSEEGYTLTGTDPLAALVTLQSLGADVVGCNCSTGPRAMLNVIKQMKPYATVPLHVKPNAGLPTLVNGQTTFTMSAEEFAGFTQPFIEAGANLIGGCCGTGPDFIRALSNAASGTMPLAPQRHSLAALSSARKAEFLPKDGTVKIIGERINPTGKKKLQASLQEGKLDRVKRYAMDQKRSGATFLDVNMGMAGIDEAEMMLKSVRLLSTISALPLVIDSSSPNVIEQALRLYPGRALINSISAERKKQERLLQVAAKYGAMFILLPLTDDEIPATSEGRAAVVQQIYERALEYDLTKDDIVIDGLTMTVSSDQQAAVETLKFLRWSRYEFDTNTVLGLSNVSFGLPQRKWVNAAFMAMAIQNGLTTAIANPNEELLMNIKMAADVLVANDKGSTAYISAFAPPVDGETSQTPQSSASRQQSQDQTIAECVIHGDDHVILDLVKHALAEGKEPRAIVDLELIPAINKVGDLYEQKHYFLPQLIASADTMKKAFEFLEPLLTSNTGENAQKPKVILATVKGDIHDIGKNIVGLMLKNYGFEVIDLGKDVACDTILETAVKENGHIIGLSALMTTTMVEIQHVIKKAKARNLDVKFMIGGAVITQEYATEVQADGYARDSIEAVKLAQRLSNTASRK